MTNKKGSYILSPLEMGKGRLGRMSDEHIALGVPVDTCEASAVAPAQPQRHGRHSNKWRGARQQSCCHIPFIWRSAGQHAEQILLRRAREVRNEELAAVADGRGHAGELDGRDLDVAAMRRHTATW